MTNWSVLKEKPWIWAWLGTALVWTVIAGLSGVGAGGQVVSAPISFGTFFVIVALGQMFVITLDRATSICTFPIR